MNHLVNMGIAGFNVEALKHTCHVKWEDIFERINDLNTHHGFEVHTRPLFYQEFTNIGKQGHNSVCALVGNNLKLEEQSNLPAISGRLHCTNRLL